MTGNASFTLIPKGPFDLGLLAGFGFGPDTGRPEAGEAAMRLAFCRDDLGGNAGVVLRQGTDGAVEGELSGTEDVAAVERQVARILSLDHDGGAWLEVGTRDPVIGELQRRYPGLRPPLFHPPYEAAAWAIISARRPARQAAVTRRLSGIGPFYAMLVLVRSTGHTDLLPESEPRLLTCAAHYYGLPAPPSGEQLAELADSWRPFRTWGAVLLRYAGGREPSGWPSSAGRPDYLRRRRRQPAHLRPPKQMP